MVWENCSPGFLGKVTLGWSRGESFEGLALWKTRSYSDLDHPLFCRHITSKLIPQKGSPSFLSPCILCSEPLSHLCSGHFPAWPVILSPPCLLIPVGQSRRKPLTPGGNDLSLWIHSQFTSQPHLDVFHSASDHALYNSEVYLINAYLVY